MSEQQNSRIEQAEGEVKWFDPRKGFGFVVGPDGQDIFVHFSVIEGDGFRVLRDGTKVVYDAESSDKGWKATKVVRLDTEEDPEIVVPRRTYTRTPRR
ncbi:MAG: CspA family cold shock protein [Phycisphaerales bacterium]|jgi:CspA family cold shock protein